MASDQRLGGSLMRVYRDTRFAKNAEPYKTNVGIQFRHEQGRDIHAPGLLRRTSRPTSVSWPSGLWRPEAGSLARIRQAIVNWPTRGVGPATTGSFAARFALDGNSLKRPPRGFPADHPGRGLKRTDFIAVEEFEEAGRSRQGSWTTWPHPSPPAGPLCVSCATPLRRLKAKASCGLVSDQATPATEGLQLISIA